ncbi:MAG: sugar phosphate isomerase/epimerase [Opitutaceae bacterium]|nr:sugar phosphate isomerase/epimerase [Verrucomicrobiales bacterium]
MSHLHSRREFFGRSLGAGALVAGLTTGPFTADAILPIPRSGLPRLHLGLAAYSFRQSFQDVLKGDASAAKPGRSMDMLQFVDYCADQGCLGAELTSYFFPKTVDDAYLREVRRRAFLRGIIISGTAVGNSFVLPKGEKRDQEIVSVKQWIDRASVLGAPHIRIFAGSLPAGLGLAAAQKLCIEAIEECCDYAGQKGIYLGLENHGGIVAEPEGLLEIVKAVQSPWFGVNLDTGNFHTDPYSDIKTCAPFAVNVQIKVAIKRKDQKESAPADLGRLVTILREAGYQGFVTLEYEEKEDPWTAVPEWLNKLRSALDR